MDFVLMRPRQATPKAPGARRPAAGDDDLVLIEGGRYTTTLRKVVRYIGGQPHRPAETGRGRDPLAAMAAVRPEDCAVDPIAAHLRAAVANPHGLIYSFGDGTEPERWPNAFWAAFSTDGARAAVVRRAHPGAV